MVKALDQKRNSGEAELPSDVSRSKHAMTHKEGKLRVEEATNAS